MSHPPVTTPIDLAEANVPIGLPMPSTDACVKDENGAMLPVGEVGDLCIKGPQLMKGYWNRPEDTAQVIDADGCLQTSDMAKIDEKGLFHIVDPTNDLLLLSGFNVYPTEVVAVIALLHCYLEIDAVRVPANNPH